MSLSILTLLIGTGLWSLVVIFKSRRFQVGTIPILGYSGLWTSYITAIKFLKNGDDVLLDGCRKYKNKVFRVAQLDRWLLVVNGAEHFTTYRDAPENVLSFKAAMNELLQMDHTFGNQIERGTAYAAAIGRFISPRNLVEILPELLDELNHALETHMRNIDDAKDWTPLAVIEPFQRIICQSINRVFVGTDVCRNEEFQDIAMQFTTSIAMAASLINLFPDALKPLAGKAFSKVPVHVRSIVKHISPLIAERQRLASEYGPGYSNKPNDLLEYLIDCAETDEERSPEVIGLRLLNMNVAALHTTTMTFIHALYQLASMPECICILRTEVEETLGRDSALWTRDMLEGCWKLDSFFKESNRVNYLSAISMARKTLQPITLADGTTVPPGDIIAYSTWAAHMSADEYDDAETFKPFRFSDKREAIASQRVSVTEDAKLRMTGVGPHYLHFGAGSHICGGRFMASTELKALMAMLLLGYEFRTEQEGIRPADSWFGAARIPDPQAKLLFKRKSC